MDHGAADAVARRRRLPRPTAWREMTLAAHARLRSQGMDDRRACRPWPRRCVARADGATSRSRSPRSSSRPPAVARTALEALLEGFHRALRAAQGRALGPRLRRPRAARACPPARLAGGQRGLARALRPRPGRRVPGHQPGPARPDRGAARRWNPALLRRRRAPVDLPVPQRRPPGLPRPARPRRSADPGTELLRASRQLPLAAGSARGGERGGRRAARRLRRADLGPAAAGVRRARRHPSSCSSPRTTRSGDAPRWKSDEIQLEPPPSEAAPSVVAEARFLARRLRELVDADEAERGDIVVLLRAFTHVDAYEEALARAGLDPYVVGGRGYWSQQQVEDLVRLLGCISQPARRRAPLRRPRVTRRRREPGCALAAAPGRRVRSSHIWPLVEWRYGGAERQPFEPDPEWLEHVPGEDAERLQRFCSILGPLRDEAPLLGLEALVERAMTAFGYDLALLAPPGRARAGWRTSAS